MNGKQTDRNGSGRGKSDESPSFCPCEHEEDAVAVAIEEFSVSIRSAVDSVADLFRVLNRSNKEMIDNICRALVFSSGGEHFEQAVSAVIRNYCAARADVLKYQRDDSLDATTRDDIVAGFKRVLEHHRHELTTLGVVIEEVAHGTPVDPTVHSVGRQRDRTESAQHVERCLTPIFRWTTAAGGERLRPAEVTVSSRPSRLES